MASFWNLRKSACELQGQQEEGPRGPHITWLQHRKAAYVDPARKAAIHILARKNESDRLQPDCSRPYAENMAETAFSYDYSDTILDVFRQTFCAAPWFRWYEVRYANISTRNLTLEHQYPHRNSKADP